MPKIEGGEFWRGIKLIEPVFRANAQPEAYVANALIKDERCQRQHR